MVEDEFVQVVGDRMRSLNRSEKELTELSKIRIVTRSEIKQVQTFCYKYRIKETVTGGNFFRMVGILLGHINTLQEELTNDVLNKQNKKRRGRKPSDPNEFEDIPESVNE